MVKFISKVNQKRNRRINKGRFKINDVFNNGKTRFLKSKDKMYKKLRRKIKNGKQIRLTGYQFFIHCNSNLTTNFKILGPLWKRLTPFQKTYYNIEAEDIKMIALKPHR